MVEVLVEDLLVIHPTLETYLKSLELSDINNPQEIYNMIIKLLLKILRTGTDQALLEKIKLIPKDPSITDEVYKAIGILDVPSIPRTVAQPKKGAPRPTKVPTKLVFDPLFPEKCIVCPCLNEKTKMLIVNRQYEKMYRNNMIECVNIIKKLDDIEKIKQSFDDNVQALNERYIEFLIERQFTASNVKLEKFNYNMDEEGNPDVTQGSNKN